MVQLIKITDSLLLNPGTYGAIAIIFAAICLIRYIWSIIQVLVIYNEYELSFFKTFQNSSAHLFVYGAIIHLNVLLAIITGFIREILLTIL